MRSGASAALAVLVTGLAGCDWAFGFDVPASVGPSASPRALVFDNAASGGDLEEFPVLVALDATVVDQTLIADPSTDLRFHDPATGTDLPFEVERWDPTGESVVWVLVPRITAKSTTDRILMFFGADAGGVESPAAVWTSYDLVVHGTGLRNSAGPAYAPTAIDVPATPGTIGDGLQLSATGDHRVTFADGGTLFDAWPQFSLEMWLYPDYASPDLDGEPRILDHQGPLNAGRLFSPSTEGPLLMQIDMHFLALGSGNRHDTFLNAFVPGQVWSHVLYTFDGRTLWVHRNGTYANLLRLPEDARLQPATGELQLGDSGTALAGMIDEVRVSQKYRSPDWAYAQYLSMARRFITFAAP